MSLKTAFPTLLALFVSSACAAASVKPVPAPSGMPHNRVASFQISQDFLNEAIAGHVKSEIIPELKVAFDPKLGRIYFRGVIDIPVEELRAISLDAKMSKFRFQIGVKPDVTEQGHLKLEFPLNETYFYPANSKDIKADRVIVPVQMLSVALASARGYLAALSGDFSGIDRREKKLKAIVADLDREIKSEKNADALEDLKTDREAQQLKLEAIPVERRQLENTGKDLSRILGFTGEKDVNLNEELGASKNAIVLKIKLSQLVPYLKDVELGGVRILHNVKDGPVQDMLSIDLNSNLATKADRPSSGKMVREPSPYQSAIILRLRQTLFETQAVQDAEATAGGSKIRDLKFDFREDGLHVSGGYHVLLVTIPFDTTIDVVSTGLDAFDVRVRELGIAGMDFDYLKKVALGSIRKRLEDRFPGVCSFEDAQDGAERILKVKVDPVKLMPAFPNLHLVDVDVRDRVFLMKIGKADAKK